MENNEIDRNGWKISLYRAYGWSERGYREVYARSWDYPGKSGDETGNSYKRVDRIDSPTIVPGEFWCYYAHLLFAKCLCDIFARHFWGPKSIRLNGQQDAFRSSAPELDQGQWAT